MKQKLLALCCALVLLLDGIGGFGGAETEASPFDLGGPFTLIDQNGDRRSEADPDGRLQLVFFGYANCPDMCLVTLPFMGQITDALADEGIEITPVMITVDPEFDTPETLGPALRPYHPDFVGLTGSERRLRAVRAQFGVEVNLLFEAPDGQQVYYHSGPLFLLDGDGTFLTVLPPVLPEAMFLDILRGYATGTS